jgi:hypothetical protein
LSTTGAATRSHRPRPGGYNLGMIYVPMLLEELTDAADGGAVLAGPDARRGPRRRGRGDRVELTASPVGVLVPGQLGREPVEARATRPTPAGSVCASGTYELAEPPPWLLLGDVTQANASAAAVIRFESWLSAAF